MEAEPGGGHDAAGRAMRITSLINSECKVSDPRNRQIQLLNLLGHQLGLSAR